MNDHQRLDAWIDDHFDDEVAFLQQLVRVPTDTPPGDNAPHAERTAELLAAMGLPAERHPVPAAEVQAQGMQSITNLIVRRRFGGEVTSAAGAVAATAGSTPKATRPGAVAIAPEVTVDTPPGTAHHPRPGVAGDPAREATGGPAPDADLRAAAATAVHPVIALNAHGDVVPPGDGWTHDPYRGDVVDGRLYGRAAAVSKSDFATYTFALRAVEALNRAGPAVPLHGSVELHFTYDEEFGGELGPGWLLRHGLTKPDLLIAAGFSYQIVTAHNGCLQFEIVLHGVASHAAYPETGVDALQAANRLLTALYAYNGLLRTRRSEVPGITHPYLNVGRIEGGSNTNVVPGRVLLKIDRRMIPEENSAEVEAELRALIERALGPEATLPSPDVRVEVRRLLRAEALKPLPGIAPLVAALQRHGEAVFGEPLPTSGTPLYTDVRLYGEHGVPAVIYGAGPRTVLESNAKRADENLALDDLRRATKVVARTLFDLLGAAHPDALRARNLRDTAP